MCTTCGCGDSDGARLIDPDIGHSTAIVGHGADDHAHGPGGHAHSHDNDHEHDHSHGHHHHPHDEAHAHDHPHDHGLRRRVDLEQDVLAKNNRMAERNRGWFDGRNVLALNLVSSPGAGKTTLLERTLNDLGGTLDVSVVEGDQETTVDADRIRATGCRSVQVNTGTGCHLEAGMIASAIRQLNPQVNSVLMIENVGNLVCPALFDLGERAKVAILSVTEGDDKPLKYPHLFRASSLMIINKIDLLPYVTFDTVACIDYARRINPDIEVLQLSATTGAGVDGWYCWLRARRGTTALEAAS